ncbi:MAG: creatininase family protein [Sulfitobacter sp.]
MIPQGYWADLPSTAFSDLPGTCIAVLPLGAVEQHGPHLPLSVDRDLADEIVQRMLNTLQHDQSVLVLPTLAITKSGEHDRFPGTLSLGPETLLAVLRDIGASVARAGVTRLVFLNAHGGNIALLEVAGRELRIKHGMVVASCSWFGFADYDGVISAEDLAHDIHAGDIETSAMLAAHPDKVDMGKAQDFRPAMRQWNAQFEYIGLNGQPARPAWIADDLHVDGACGDAAAATPAKGEHLLTTASTGFAAFLAEFSHFDLAGRVE